MRAPNTARENWSDPNPRGVYTFPARAHSRRPPARVAADPRAIVRLAPPEPADPDGAREPNPSSLDLGLEKSPKDWREACGASDMSSSLAALQQRKERLDEELKQVEKQVYDLETTYLNDSSQYGNVLKGFEGFLSQTKNTSQKKARNFKPEDRLFSLSSSSSPVVDEIAAERAEEKTVTTQSGRKAGGGTTYR